MLYPKRSVEDAEYLLRRAQTEVQLADQAKQPAAAEAHNELARLFLGQVFGVALQSEQHAGEADSAAGLRRLNGSFVAGDING